MIAVSMFLFFTALVSLLVGIFFIFDIIISYLRLKKCGDKPTLLYFTNEIIYVLILFSWVISYAIYYQGLQ